MGVPWPWFSLAIQKTIYKFSSIHDNEKFWEKRCKKSPFHVELLFNKALRRYEILNVIIIYVLGKFWYFYVSVHFWQLLMNECLGYKTLCLIQTSLIKFSRVVSTTQHNLACFNSLFTLQKYQRIYWKSEIIEDI